ncbi:HTTM domain-containing protein [Flavobacterium luteum]|uniref:HTTM domain-containing protein n=1 Tax=Flavobacterium luteum TaxID=2026654 RepID=A0A7J5A9T5_9FLAO|nr:HTTM domain-containing protein [Flavobacterium luteum]KAB1154307.1 hypothetical protein F6464_13055 [Flavobacterium luteum]
MTILLFTMVCITFVNYRLWWATIINIGISLFYFITRFPRLANHANIEFFLAILILFLFVNKVIYPKLKIAPNLVGWVFRISVMTIYFYTGFHKLNSDYFNPCVSCVNEVNEYIIGHLTATTFKISDNVSCFFQYASIVMEMLIPFGLLWNPTRKGSALLLLFFHFYLNLAVYSDFGSLAVFLIVGCILDFESKTIHYKISRAIRYYVFFTLLTFGVKIILIKYKFNPYYLGFIQGLIFNIGWIIFFYYLFTNVKGKSYLINKRHLFILSTCFILISFWTLRTYIGLGNSGNFTMFSNLVTEKSTNNHLLIDTKKTKIFNFEEDNVLILKLHDTLKKEQFEHNKIPISEFQFLSSNWCRLYKVKLNCTLVYKKDTIVIDDLRKSEFVKTQWWNRYLYFRKIQTEGPNTCRW